MTRSEAQRKRKFFEWLKQAEPYAENQPLMVVDYVFQAFGNYMNDEEIKQVLTIIKQTVKEKLEVKNG